MHITTQGDPKAVCEILKHPSVMIGQSDAGAHMGYDARFGYCTAFLGRWVRDYGIMRLEEAVSKLTFRVASIFGLNDRGLLRPGMAADVVVFDPATINTLEPEYVQDLPGNETRMIQNATGVPLHGGERRGGNRKRRGDRRVLRESSPADGVAELTAPIGACTADVRFRVDISRASVQDVKQLQEAFSGNLLG